MPAQTRGFLFSDLRGYSAFVERHGDRAARNLLARYRAAVRAVIARFGGAEIRTEGDSFYVVFESVSQAVEAGLAIQIDLAEMDGEPIQAGIGIHAGEVEDDAEQGIVSTAVNIAARVCALAEPGEVLVTDTVRALTRSYLAVTFRPRGRRRLKGISDAVSVYAVLHGNAPRERQHRWLGILRRRPLPLALGLVSAVVVASLVLAATIREGIGLVTGDRFGTADAVASPASSPAAASRGPLASGLAQSFPTEAEARLLTLVEEPFRGFCESAPHDSLPVYIENHPHAEDGRADLAFAAGIICDPFRPDAPDELAYWLVPPASWHGGAAELIANRAGAINAPAGSCAELRRAIEIWQAGPLSGQLLCFSAEGIGSVLYWTYDGSDVFAKAVRADGDLDSLLEWWREEARYRPPPD